jgi:hypothetical protein
LSVRNASPRWRCLNWKSNLPWPEEASKPKPTRTIATRESRPSRCYQTSSSRASSTWSPRHADPFRQQKLLENATASFTRTHYKKMLHKNSTSTQSLENKPMFDAAVIQGEEFIKVQWELIVVLASAFHGLPAILKNWSIFQLLLWIFCLLFP